MNCLCFWRKPTLLELAREELDNAERALMRAETTMEWARSDVTYNNDRIARLHVRIAEFEAKGEAK